LRLQLLDAPFERRVLLGQALILLGELLDDRSLPRGVDFQLSQLMTESVDHLSRTLPLRLQLESGVLGFLSHDTLLYLKFRERQVAHKLIHQTWNATDARLRESPKRLATGTIQASAPSRGVAARPPREVRCCPLCPHDQPARGIDAPH